MELICYSGFLAERERVSRRGRGELYLLMPMVEGHDGGVE